jgi:hypothetical protein
MVVSLHTVDLPTALRRRHAALAVFEGRIDQARDATSADLIIQSALRWRDTLARLVKGDMSTFSTTKEPEPGRTRLETAISVADWAVDDEADAIASTHGDAAAEAFVKVAHALATPLAPLIRAWLAGEDIEARSKGDHQRAVDELLKWAKATAPAKRGAIRPSHRGGVRVASVGRQAGSPEDHQQAAVEPIFPLAVFGPQGVRRDEPVDGP